MSSYLPIVEVAATHSYFGDAPMPIRFVPDDASSRTMGNAGLLMRPTDRGVAFLGDARSSYLFESASDNVVPSVMLKLKAYSLDPFMANYTDFGGPKKAGELLYFEAVANGPGTYDIGVSSRNVVSVDDARLNGVLKRHDRGAPPLFVISFPVFGPQKGEGKGSELAPVRYRIRFEARQVHWKYYVNGTIRDAALSVRDMDGKIGFEPVTDLTYPKGHVFISSSRIPLSATTERRFQLLDGKRVILKRLPAAGPRIINTERVNGQLEWVSEIYVNR